MKRDCPQMICMIWDNWDKSCRNLKLRLSNCLTKWEDWDQKSLVLMQRTKYWKANWCTLITLMMDLASLRQMIHQSMLQTFLNWLLQAQVTELLKIILLSSKTTLITARQIQVTITTITTTHTTMIIIIITKATTTITEVITANSTTLSQLELMSRPSMILINFWTRMISEW